MYPESRVGPAADRGGAKEMNELERILNGIPLNRIIQLDSRKPVKTSFRATYPVPLPTEVVDLIRFLKAHRNEYNLHVNERLERVVRKEVIRIAQEYNKMVKETEEKQLQTVDSQPRPS